MSIPVVNRCDLKNLLPPNGKFKPAGNKLRRNMSRYQSFAAGLRVVVMHGCCAVNTARREQNAHRIELGIKTNKAYARQLKFRRMQRVV